MTDKEKIEKIKDFVLQRLETTQKRAKNAKTMKSKQQELINSVRAETYYSVLKYIEGVELK